VVEEPILIESIDWFNDVMNQYINADGKKEFDIFRMPRSSYGDILVRTRAQ